MAIAGCIIAGYGITAALLGVTVVLDMAINLFGRVQ